MGITWNEPNSCKTMLGGWVAYLLGKSDRIKSDDHRQVSVTYGNFYVTCSIFFVRHGWENRSGTVVASHRSNG